MVRDEALSSQIRGVDDANGGSLIHVRHRCTARGVQVNR